MKLNGKAISFGQARSPLLADLAVPTGESEHTTKKVFGTHSFRSRRAPHVVEIGAMDERCSWHMGAGDGASQLQL